MTYPGGKAGAGVYQTIINQQPPHACYVEPFLGSGAVMIRKLAATENIGIEKDGLVAARWKDIADVEVIVGDGISYLQKRRWSTDTLIYCDPPYMPETRSRRKIYQHEMSPLDHSRLLDVLTSLPCMIQISGYVSQLYSEKLRKWRMISFNAMTRGGLRRECLWMNYPEPAQLHDYRYLGLDFRERERIARRALRWKRRIQTLPELERRAIMAELL